MTTAQILGLMTGIAFGFLLQKGRVLRFDKQLDAMLLKDMTIMKFMMSAILVGMVGILALSGMGTLQMVEENVRTCADPVALSEADRRSIDGHLKQLKRMADLYCTGCNYCLPCPQDIPIPKYMDVHNRMQLNLPDDAIRDRFQMHWEIEPAGAAECIECGACETRCTQHLPIMSRLKTLAAFHA